jgi:hypothetical protein
MVHLSVGMAHLSVVALHRSFGSLRRSVVATHLRVDVVHRAVGFIHLYHFLPRVPSFWHGNGFCAGAMLTVGLSLRPQLTCEVCDQLLEMEAESTVWAIFVGAGRYAHCLACGQVVPPPWSDNYRAVWDREWRVRTFQVVSSQWAVPTKDDPQSR